jgi:hypothetical protein
MSGAAVVLSLALCAEAQQANVHIGYVYPAGGQQGAAFEAVVAGQFLGDTQRIHVSGDGVRAEVVDLIRPISSRELNALRIEMDELLARRSVVRQDFRALETFRSFKNAKSIKKDEAKDDQEIEDLKKKYADAKWTAADEQRLAEVRRKMQAGVRRPANPAISELAVVRVTVAPDAAVGQRELRLATPIALSNPLVFHVGNLPEISEPASKNIAEQRSSIARTTSGPKNPTRQPDTQITLPAVVNGQILPGAADRFRFAAGRGQHLVVAVEARQLIPYIPDAVPGWFQATLALYDAAGKELQYDDDYRFHPDPVLHYEIPADGDYVVEIKDAIYRGREDFVYRITIGELPFVTSAFPLGGQAGTQTKLELTGWNLPARSLTVDDRTAPGIHPVASGRDKWGANSVPFAVDTLPECLEAEPTDPAQTSQSVTLPTIVNGRIGAPNDTDVFSFTGRAGSEVVAEVLARRLNSPLDSVLTLTDASGKQLAVNNDHDDKGAGLLTHQADSWLQVKLPADGTYQLRLSDAQHQGGAEFGYRLRISPPRPDFELRVAPCSISVRSGATVPLTVYAIRRDGFAGEIDIGLTDPPAGFTLSGGRIPAQQDQVRLTLTVPAASQESLIRLQLEGRALIQQQQVTHAAVPAEDMMQAFAYRHLVPAQELNVAVLGRAPVRPAVKILGELPVKIPAGGTARIRIGTLVGPMFRLVQLQLSDPPEGIGIESVTPSREGVDVVVSSDAAKVKPGLAGNLIVTASAKGQGSQGKAKLAAMPRNAMAATLPAIPFEITNP